MGNPGAEYLGPGLGDLFASAFEAIPTGVYVGPADPTATPPDPAAPLGSIYMRTNGQLWFKTGPTANDWFRVGIPGNLSHSGLLDLASDDHLQYLNRSGLRPMTGPLAMGGSRVTGLGAPSANTDAATVQYVLDAISPIAGEIGPGVQDVPALRAVDTTSTVDKQIRLVEDKGALYRFNATGADPDDGDFVVAPTVGPGRWYKTQAATQDHSLLINLTSGDPHTQYLPVGGSRAMLANLPMGGKDVTGLFNVSTTVAGTAPHTVTRVNATVGAAAPSFRFDDASGGYLDIRQDGLLVGTKTYMGFYANGAFARVGTAGTLLELQGNPIRLTEAGGTSVLDLQIRLANTSALWNGRIALADDLEFQSPYNTVYSTVADSVSAVGLATDTVGLFTTAGALLLAVRNQGSTKFSIDKDGSVALSGTVDGRDVAADGTALDSHLNGTGTKHNADEVAVAGTYANIPLTPTDLEATIGAIDSALGAIPDYWARAATTLSPTTAGDSLDMGAGGYVSSVANGASAVGFLLNTLNTLSTAGAKLLSIKNNGVEKFAVDKDGQIVVGGPPAPAFTSLTDAPASYSSMGGKLVAVNVGETGLEFVPLPPTGSLSSLTSIEAFIDTNNDSLVEAFTVYHDVSTPSAPKRLFEVRENGEVEIFGGPLIGGASPFQIRSKTVEVPGVYATGTITVIDNTVELGDTLSVTDESGGVWTVTASATPGPGLFVFGGSTAATATNICNAFNALMNLWIPAFSVLGSVVTVKAIPVGPAGNTWALSESDGATDNYTLSGPNLTGGLDGSTAFEFDTVNAMAADGTKLLSLRNAGVEYLSIRKGTDVYFTPDSIITSLYDNLGNTVGELSIEDNTYGTLNFKNFQFYITASSDLFPWAPGAGPSSGDIGVSGQSGFGGYGSSSISASDSNRYVSIDALSAYSGTFHHGRITVGDNSGLGGHQNYFTLFGNGAGPNLAEWLYHDATILPAAGMASTFGMDSGGAFFGGLGTITGLISVYNYYSWPFRSLAEDGATSVGFELTAGNALTTNGSKVLSVKNAAAEYLALRRGTNLYGSPSNVILSLKDNAGVERVEMSVNGSSSFSTLLTGLTGYGVELLDDYAFGAGYKYCALNFTQATNPNATLNVEMNGVGTVSMEASGGQPGGGPGTAPRWFVDVVDNFGAEGTAELGLFAEDYTACNRTDVRFNAIAKGYIGLASTGAFFGADALASPSKWLFESGAVNGASAVGYELNTRNSLTTDGSKLLSLKNNGTEQLNARRGTDLFGVAGVNLLELDQATGVRRLQHTVEDATYQGLLYETDRMDTPYATSDWAFGAGYSETMTASQVKGTDSSGLSAGVPYRLDYVSGNSFGRLATSLLSAAAGTGGNGTRWAVVIQDASAASGFQYLTYADRTEFGGLKTNVRWNVGVSGFGPSGRNSHVGLDSAGLLVGASGTTSGGAPSKWGFQSLAVDGATAVAFELDTKATLSNAAAKLLSLKNNTVEKMSVDKDGKIASAGITLSGPATLKRAAVSTTPYSTAGENLVGVTTTAVLMTVTLSNADKVAGRTVEVKDESGNAGTGGFGIVVQPQTGTIDGQASLPIGTDYGVLRVYSDGANWFTR